MESGFLVIKLILLILKDQFTLQILVKQVEVYMKLIGQPTHVHVHLLVNVEVLLYLGLQPLLKIGQYLPQIALLKMVAEMMITSVTLELQFQVLRSMLLMVYIQLTNLIQQVTQKVLSHFLCQLSKNLLDLYLLLKNGLLMLPN